MARIETQVTWSEAEKAVLALADTCWQGMSTANAAEAAFPEYATHLRALAVQGPTARDHGAYGYLGQALEHVLTVLASVAGLRLMRPADLVTDDEALVTVIRRRMLSTGEDATQAVTKLISEGTITNG